MVGAELGVGFLSPITISKSMPGLVIPEAKYQLDRGGRIISGQYQSWARVRNR